MGGAASKLSSDLAAAGLFGTYVGVNLANLLLAAASQRQHARYINSTAVALSEVIKSAVCVLSIAGTERSVRRACAAVMEVLLQPRQLLKVAIPSALYTVQNNVIYGALSQLDAVTFQITYQLKIVASLLSSRLILGSRISRARWASVALLTAGVILVQLSQHQAIHTDKSAKNNQLLGLLGVLLACACSGLAGAVMEALLKTSVPLAHRNLQASQPAAMCTSVRLPSEVSPAGLCRLFDACCSAYALQRLEENRARRILSGILECVRAVQSH